MTMNPGSASVSGAGAVPKAPESTSRKVFFELVEPTAAMDPIGPPEGAGAPGAPAGVDPSDLAAVKYYCALNFNVGGTIKKNRTVERVAEDGPLSPGAFQCARECNKMGAGCAAFGVVAGSTCYIMSAVRARDGPGGGAGDTSGLHLLHHERGAHPGRAAGGGGGRETPAGSTCYIMSAVRTRDGPRGGGAGGTSGLPWERR
jgi:hypothetical protein